MAIPQAQIETWSAQGAISTSSNTYNTVGLALNSCVASNNNLTINTYLQGSYGNDTNIYSESDVDVVAVLKTYNSMPLFYANLNNEQKTILGLRDVAYDYPEFKAEILKGLNSYFQPQFVVVGNKAIQILPNSNRRDCDIIVAIPYRFYFEPLGWNNFYEGITFYAVNSGEQIINYPKLHSKKASGIHQSSGNNFKGVVRVFKNIRNYLADNYHFNKETAPSYFIECMISNVPTNQYESGIYNSFINVINFLLKTDMTNFMCVNGLVKLFGTANDQWKTDQAIEFFEPD